MPLPDRLYIMNLLLDEFRCEGNADEVANIIEEIIRERHGKLDVGFLALHGFTGGRGFHAAAILARLT